MGYFTTYVVWFQIIRQAVHYFFFKNGARNIQLWQEFPWSFLRPDPQKCWFHKIRPKLFSSQLQTHPKFCIQTCLLHGWKGTQKNLIGLPIWLYEHDVLIGHPEVERKEIVSKSLSSIALLCSIIKCCFYNNWNITKIRIASEGVSGHFSGVFLSFCVYLVSILCWICLF